jgi:dihydrolipoamide dehydrogenase
MKFDIIVTGSGPGGYARLRAAQLGLQGCGRGARAPGRNLPQLGCIPTKALPRSAKIFEVMRHAKYYGADNVRVDAE